MATVYIEYTTLADLRTYSGSTATGEDTLLLDLIRTTSRDINKIGGHKYYPRVETRTYDYPDGYQLDFDDDLLALTTLSNPSGTTVASTNYRLIPVNGYPKFAVRLLGSTTVQWQQNASGFNEDSVTALGVWGYHPNYDDAWLDISATLAAAITTTSATSFTCTTGKVRAGDLLKIDSEYIYAVSVSVSGSDTVTCIRGVNGSTAATHLISTALYRWYFPEISTLCTEAVIARHKLKNNPVGERIQIGEYTVATPQDIHAYIERRLVAEAMGPSVHL